MKGLKITCEKHGQMVGFCSECARLGEHHKWAEGHVSPKAAEAPRGQDCDCVIEIDSSGTATVIHQAGCRYSQLYEAFRRACEQVWRCTDAPGQTLESTMQFYLTAPAAPSERAEAKLPDDLRITVCDACKQASCWQGVFFCEKYQSAGTMELTVAELRQLDLEHPSYWGKDPNARAGLSSQEGK